jgi:acyl-CoA thioesterase
MNLQEFLLNDKFANHLGIELLEAANGKAKTKLVIKDKHLNAVQIVHGGVIFLLADFTLASAANSYGNIAVAVNASIYFLNAAQKGTLYAEAKEISRNNKLASYTINVTNDKGELVANYQGMVYRKKETFLDK